MRKLVLGIAFTGLAIVAGAVRADDMQTAQEIANHLYKSGKFAGRPIAVKYQDGTVWVKGQLADSKQEESALSMLYGRSDVKNVVNLLTVDGKSEGGKSEGSKSAASATDKPAPATATSAESEPLDDQSADDSASESASNEGSTEPAGNSSSSKAPETGSIASRLARVFAGGRAAKAEESTGRNQRSTSEPTPARAQAAVANDDLNEDVPDAVPPESFVERQEVRRPAKRPAAQPSQSEARRAQYSMPQSQSRTPSKKPIARTASRQAPQGAPGRNQVAYGQPGQIPGGPQGRPVGYAPNGMPTNGGPVPMHVMGGPGPAAAPISYDQPHLPNYAWPSYAAYPNYAGVTYPKQYSPTAWPYIGPFYPYPQVPLGWRRVTLEWDDGWWWLDFDDGRKGWGCGHCSR